MTPRILAALLVFVLAGDSPPADPFGAALLGRSGPNAVEAPSFDADRAANAWSLRPRRQIVDGLATYLLRGEAESWRLPAKEKPALAPPPRRIPEEFEAGTFEVVDRLASWVPADAAVVFFGSLAEANVTVEELSRFLPNVFPGICGDPPRAGRDALRRAVDMLLLPTIWRSNPEARTGTRQVALVVSDPDVRWAPDIALLCEVEDASLVRAHRQATFSWESRGNRRIRVDGLDAVADDGSIRSFFALEGGVALWSTTRSLRERVLAAGSAKAPSLLTPPARDYAFARRALPGAGGPFLVVPEAFLARIHAFEFRARRAAGLRCEAARLLLDAKSLGGAKVTVPPAPGASCPAGGVLSTVACGGGASCSLHGTAVFPTPLGDVPPVSHSAADVLALRPPAVDAVAAAGLPIAARWRASPMEVLVPGGEPGKALLDLLVEKPWGGEGVALGKAAYARMRSLRSVEAKPGDAARWFLESTGLEFDRGGSGRSLFRKPPATRAAGGVLTIDTKFVANVNGWDLADLVLEWR